MKPTSSKEAAAAAIVMIITLCLVNGLCAAGMYLISSVLLEAPMAFIDAFRIMWGITFIAGGYSIAREVF